MRNIPDMVRASCSSNDDRPYLPGFRPTTDLERVGDEARKVALYARSIYANGRRVLRSQFFFC
jgi:hypothetical protein